jgi:arginine decarboxylase
LFGDTNTAHVRLDDDGRVHFEEIVEGDTVAEVLRYVQFEPDALRRKLRRTLETAVRENKLTLEESGTLRRFYEQGLSGSTYLS